MNVILKALTAMSKHGNASLKIEHVSPRLYGAPVCVSFTGDGDRVLFDPSLGSMPLMAYGASPANALEELNNMLRRWDWDEMLRAE